MDEQDKDKAQEILWWMSELTKEREKLEAQLREIARAYKKASDTLAKIADNATRP